MLFFVCFANFFSISNTALYSPRPLPVIFVPKATNQRRTFCFIRLFRLVRSHLYLIYLFTSQSGSQSLLGWARVQFWQIGSPWVCQWIGPHYPRIYWCRCSVDLRGGPHRYWHVSIRGKIKSTHTQNDKIQSPSPKKEFSFFFFIFWKKKKKEEENEREEKSLKSFEFWQKTCRHALGTKWQNTCRPPWRGAGLMGNREGIWVIWAKRLGKSSRDETFLSPRALASAARRKRLIVSVLSAFYLSFSLEKFHKSMSKDRDSLANTKLFIFLSLFFHRAVKASANTLALHFGAFLNYSKNTFFLLIFFSLRWRDQRSKPRNIKIQFLLDKERKKERK